MFLEIELKLSIDPADTTLLYRHPLLIKANPTPVSEKLVSRYFDTPDLYLWHQGLSLRTRETEGLTIQTLKTAGKKIGDLHHRHEWDQPIQGTLPNIHAFADKAVSEKIASVIGNQSLIELFHTDIKRTTWNLQIESTYIELVLDEGSINTALRKTSLYEIELELKQGDENQLNKIAKRLKETIPLTLETRSKAQRGYMLYTDNNLSSINA